jgi:hypothetical protein
VEKEKNSTGKKKSAYGLFLNSIQFFGLHVYPQMLMLFFAFLVLGTEPRVLYMKGKCSISTALHHFLNELINGKKRKRILNLI